LCCTIVFSLPVATHGHDPSNTKEAQSSAEYHNTIACMQRLLGQPI